MAFGGGGESGGGHRGITLSLELKIPDGHPGGSVVKNPPSNAGGARDMGSIPGSGRPLQ